MARSKQVSFYGPMQQALGGGQIRREFDNDPQRGLEQAMLTRGTSTSPVQSHTEGIARALQAGLGGFMRGQAKDDLEDREGKYSAGMQQALQAMQGTPGTPQGGHPGMMDVEATPATPGGYGAAANALPQGADFDQARQQFMMQGFAQDQAAEAAELARSQGIEDYRTKAEIDQEFTDGGGYDPSAPMKNFARRQELVSEFGADSPEVMRFDNYVRASQIKDIGGSIIQVDPSNPTQPIEIAPTTIPPELTPEHKGAVAEAAAIGGATGKEQGTAQASLAGAEAALPRLEDAVTELKALGEEATYTLTGQARDFVRRQINMDPTEGATSRVAYIAHVKNNVLPLLRQTFGAAFTVAEGDSLLATLGDPDSSPGEKNAVLDAFIADKKAELDVLRRQTNTNTGGGTDLKNKYGLE